MGISPDRFVPKQDGSPQSLNGLHNAGKGLGGGLLAGFTGLISGIGNAIGSLFGGGLGKDDAFYPVYVGLRDAVQPIIDKNEESLEAAKNAEASVASLVLQITAVNQAIEKNTKGVTDANKNAQSAITQVNQASQQLGKNLENLRLDLVGKLAQANAKAIDALGKSDKALESALKATNETVALLQRFTELQAMLNAEQKKLNEGFQAVDRAFEKTRVRMLAIPDDTPGTSVSLPGYITAHGQGGRHWGGKRVKITASGTWTGHVAGVLKARNGAVDVCSLDVRNGQVVDGSSRGRLGEALGSFIAGGTQVYVGALLFVVPEDTK